MSLQDLLISLMLETEGQKPKIMEFCVDVAGIKYCSPTASLALPVLPILRTEKIGWMFKKSNGFSRAFAKMMVY